MLEQGVDVNAKGWYGKTPLHIAAWYDANKVAELLISKGADVNAKDKDGKTPLRLAKDRHNQNIINLLKLHGAGGAKFFDLSTEIIK